MAVDLFLLLLSDVTVPGEFTEPGRGSGLQREETACTARGAGGVRCGKGRIYGKSADTKHVFELKIKSLVNCGCVCMYSKVL